MTSSIYTDNDFSFGMTASTASSDPDLEAMDSDEQNNLVMHPEQGDRKLSTDEGTAQVYVSDDTVACSNQNNAVIVNDKGIVINGRTHLTKDPSSIRINGFWVLNPELLTTLPSTIYTPIPVLVYSPIPYASTASSLMGILGA